MSNLNVIIQIMKISCVTIHNFTYQHLDIKISQSDFVLSYLINEHVYVL